MLVFLQNQNKDYGLFYWNNITVTSIIMLAIFFKKSTCGNTNKLYINWISIFYFFFPINNHQPIKNSSRDYVTQLHIIQDSLFSNNTNNKGSNRSNLATPNPISQPNSPTPGRRKVVDSSRGYINQLPLP